MKAQITKIIILFIFSIYATTEVQSQDIHFSQFPMTPILVSPAQTGAQYDVRAIANYKNQWAKVASPYKTYNFSFDMKLTKRKDVKGYSALGLNVFKDKAGDADLGTFQANLTYAYHLFISSKSTLGAGLYGGFDQRSINISNFQWGNQYDGLNFNSAYQSDEIIGSTSKSFFDMGGGVHWEYGKEEKYITGNNQKNYSAGVAVFHVNRPKYSFCQSSEKLNMKIVGYANALIGISNTHYSFVPGIVYFHQGSARELLFGSLFRYQFKEESKYTGNIKGSAISLGGYYRNNDALIANIFYEFSQYAIGVSYDVNVSGLKVASNKMGGIEIALRFVSPNPFLYANTKFY